MQERGKFMKVKFEKDKLFNLIKLNLKMFNLSKKIGISLVLFSFIVYIVMEKLNYNSLAYNLDVNFWDGVFKVLCYPILFLGLYFPFVLVMTTLFDVKNKYGKFIMIRTNEKYLWIISRLVSNFFISLLFTVTLFIVIFIFSYIYFRFENSWSAVIFNKDSLKLVSVLYMNNFVFSFTPMEACVISFLEIYICTCIIINLSNVVTNYISKNYISNIIISMYVFINIVSFAYKLNGGKYNLLSYIGLDTMSLIWKHNFTNFSYYNLTISQSLFISLLILIILVFINLILNRKLVIDYD